MSLFACQSYLIQSFLAAYTTLSDNMSNTFGLFVTLLCHFSQRTWLYNTRTLRRMEEQQHWSVIFTYLCHTFTRLCHTLVSHLCHSLGCVPNMNTGESILWSFIPFSQRLRLYVPEYVGRTLGSNIIYVRHNTVEHVCTRMYRTLKMKNSNTSVPNPIANNVCTRIVVHLNVQHKTMYRSLFKIEE